MLFKRRVVPLLLSFAIVLSFVFFAAEPARAASPASEERANRLHSLHLLEGTGTKPDGTPVYSLDAMPQRIHGLIMLLRLLGQEDAALACTEPNPFTDVAEKTAYAVKYTAYAFARGITDGTGPNTFNPTGELTAKMYIAFVMRALGYGSEYVYGDLKLPTQVGLLSDTLPASFAGEAIKRADMVDLSYAALTCPMKDEGCTLAEKLCAAGVFTSTEGTAAGVLGAAAGWRYDREVWDDSTLSLETVSLGSGKAYVLTANVRNPKVHVKSAMVDSTLGHTAEFADIAASSGAKAVVNGNFFEAYNDDFKYPIGHVMTDGVFLFGVSGLTSLGIKRDGTVQIGRPAVFTRLTAADGREWSAYEINSPDGFDEYASTLFTPAFGRSVVYPHDAWTLTVRAGKVTDYSRTAEGTPLAIPSDGYLVYFGDGFASTAWFREPRIGDTLRMEYYLRVEDEEGFTLDGMESIVSGGPRLVKDGVAKVIYDVNGFADEARFGASAVSTRTAAGVTADGKLMIVSAASATLQQVAEFMAAHGCTDAINLDGGYSRSIYYDGRVLASGRPLTVTLQFFVED